ncbi:tetratricopeptide repeat protein [Aurantiacibacter spongiae]|uniref:Tetratricopeptide repeat protein n=1 Tax=Aurantiacibacter spongiae TaxID=2488860 RepID=A0A3N5D742_9SPHN|nr:hypothetical protein [Aurantiacibacter spongiae]RPF70328.1 hypothetical protein EG799_00795 [Aurantiacibacter spongiae]
MNRANHPTRRHSVRGPVARLAMAAALAGGAALGSLALSAPAQAQDQQQEERQREFTPAFVEVYQPVAAMLEGEAANPEGARAQIGSVEAAAQSPDDRYAAGNLILSIGNKLNDPALQRRGLEMMLATNTVPASELARFNFFVGQLAYNAGDYAAARSAVEAAMAANYTDNDNDPGNDPEYIIIQSYVAEDNPTAAVDYTVQAAQRRLDAGQPVPERWLLRALQTTYDSELAPQAVDVSDLLLKTHPTEQNWKNAIQVVNALTEFPEDQRVDLYRLMQAAGVLDERTTMIRFIEDLDPRIMANEVGDILALGLQNGQFSATDSYYTEVKPIVDERAPLDRREIDTTIAQARSGDSLDAMNAGDVLYSLDDYARAAEMYQLAIEKGADADTARTRLGIAQTMQGDYAAAQTTFGQVDGQREPIARLWAIYAAQQAG